MARDNKAGLKKKKLAMKIEWLMFALAKPTTSFSEHFQSASLNCLLLPVTKNNLGLLRCFLVDVKSLDFSKVS